MSEGTAMTGLDKTALEAACRAVSGCTVSDPFGYDAKTRDVLSAAITAYLSALPAVTEEQVEAACRAYAPDLFGEDPCAAHVAASPLQVAYAQKPIRERMRAALEAASLSRPVEGSQTAEAPVAWRYHGPKGGWIYSSEKPKWPSEPVYIRSALVATSHAKAATPWRVFEDIHHGWWGIENDGDVDSDPILYPIKVSRERLDRIVDAHNGVPATSPAPPAPRQRRAR